MKKLILFAILLSGCGGMAPSQPSVLHVSTTEVPVAQTNQPYETQLQAVGGTTPYSWRIVGGNLPDGMVMAPNGQISGTATATGKFNFTVEVTDSSPNVQANQINGSVK